MNNSTKLKSIGIIAKEKHPAVDELVPQMLSWCKGNQTELWAEPPVAKRFKLKGSASASLLAARCDLLVVLGGDGTLLKAARITGKRQTPILGINLGSLGYLTEFTAQELLPTLDVIQRGKHQIQNRVMLAVELHWQKKTGKNFLALNEAVLHNGVLARMMDLDIHVDGQFVTSSRSDGLIISTPTGATAYSLSAGGPILQPDLEAFVLTHICPHTLTNRPIVLKDTVVIQVDLLAGTNAMLTIDGQVGEAISPGDRVVLQKAPFATRLVKPPDKNHFQILRQKLRWG